MNDKPLILVVDDDLPITILMRSLLREFGFESLTAMSGSEAVAAARERSPDLILLDKNMPGMDCAEVVREIRAREDDGRKTPILIVSGDPFSDQEIARLGADAAVQKPFDVHALIGQIRGFLDR